MFKKVKELLDAGTISQATADALDAEISGELKILEDKSTSWETKYQDLNSKFESITKTKDELETRLETIDDQIKKAKEDGKAELAGQLEEYKKSQEDLKANLESIQSENKNLSIKTGLQGELSKYKVIDNDVVMAVLSEKVTLKDDGGLAFKDGENKLSLEDGLKGFFENKPHLLSVQGNNGSGSQSGNYTGGIEKSKMSDNDKFEFIKKHGAEAYKNLN